MEEESKQLEGEIEEAKELELDKIHDIDPIEILDLNKDVVLTFGDDE